MGQSNHQIINLCQNSQNHINNFVQLWRPWLLWILLLLLHKVQTICFLKDIFEKFWPVFRVFAVVRDQERGKGKTSQKAKEAKKKKPSKKGNKALDENFFEINFDLLVKNHFHVAQQNLRSKIGERGAKTKGMSLKEPGNNKGKERETNLSNLEVTGRNTIIICLNRTLQSRQTEHAHHQIGVGQFLETDHGSIWALLNLEQVFVCFLSRVLVNGSL